VKSKFTKVLMLGLFTQIAFSAAALAAPTEVALAKLRVWACEKGVDDRDLRKALAASSGRYIGFADFGKKSLEKRFTVYDTQTGEITEHRVTHGSGNGSYRGSEFERFSSREGSRAVPGGVHVLSHYVRRGLRDNRSEMLTMLGQESSNRNSANRGITFGACGKLSTTMDKFPRPYTSMGSLCLPRSESAAVMEKLKGGAVINFDSRQTQTNRVCETQAERSDESFERTERLLTTDTDMSQVELHSLEPRDALESEGVQ